MSKRIKAWVFILWFLLSGCGILPTVPRHSQAASPTSTPTKMVSGSASTPITPQKQGYQFTFDHNFIGEAYVKGKGETCQGVHGPWTLTLEVTGSPEPGSTIQTNGMAQFTVPERSTRIQIEIPTTGKGNFQTSETMGVGEIQEALTFIFELKQDSQGANITLASTGKGTITFHLPDRDVTIPFATVFTTQPQFEVMFTRNSNCP